MNTLTLNLTDQQKLFTAYMPFIKNGGLFVACNDTYQLGDTVMLTVNLMNESEPYHFSGKVIWLTPVGASANQPVGIGVQFSPNEIALRNKIENYLGDMLKSEQQTDTL